MKAVGAGKLADSPAQENLGSGLRLGAWHLCRLAPHMLALLLLPGMDGQPSPSCTLDFRMQGQHTKSAVFPCIRCERLEADTQRGSVAPFSPARPCAGFQSLGRC